MSQTPLTEADFNRVVELVSSDLQRAEAEAAKLCRLHPGQPALENLHGVILVRMESHQAAADAFERAVKIEPRFTDAINNLASALSTLDRDEESVNWYEKLISANIKDPDIFYNYGNSLRKLGRNKEAISAYKVALSLRPLFPAAYNNMGKAWSELGDIGQARASYEKVLEMDPDHDSATYSLARILSSTQRFPSAKALYGRLLSRNPRDPDALLGMSICEINSGNQLAAIETLERVMDITPEAEGAQFLLDALRGETRDSMPAEHTRNLFDDYADRFERDLTINLQYHGPTELLELLAEAEPQARRYSNVLDVGCGTGLAGEAFQSQSARLTGIDLSPAMLAKAEAKGIYDSLAVGDAVELVGGMTETFDLVLCCDTLPYIGDLMPLFTAVGSRIAIGGHFLCSTELAEGDGYVLQTSVRFAHSPGYVTECATAAGFDTLGQKTLQLRKDASGGWTTGGIYCFVRRA